MKTYKFSLLLLLCIFAVGILKAEDKPLWVKKDVAMLNSQRSNRSYEFVKFHTHGADLTELQNNDTQPLRQFVMDLTGAQSNEVSIDSSDGCNEYLITVNTDGVKKTMTARLIDTYYEFEDFEESYFEYEYYQLFAFSYPNVVPAFDDISIAKKYKTSTTILSLVPGLGQIYKGQTTKGFLIMSGEVALIGAAVGFQIKKNEFDDNVKKGIHNVDSWKSKSTSMRVFRNISLGLGAGLYVYNLLDALLSEGSRHIVIKPTKDKSITFMPMMLTDGAAIGLRYTF